MTNQNLPQLSELQKKVLGDAVKHSGKLIFIGVLLIVCGSLGLLAEAAFSIATVTLLGSVAFIAGIFMAVHAFQSKGWKSFLIQTAFGVLYIGIGIYTWVSPVNALEGLTIWIAAILLITGVMRLISAIQHWSVGNAMWPALSGVLSIVLGIMIMNNWPATSLWVPGMLLAIELLLQGWSLFFIGIAIRKAGATTPT
jgi:uncharacterized membrane protein HdeD (DUF308 family)